MVGNNPKGRNFRPEQTKRRWSKILEVAGEGNLRLRQARLQTRGRMISNSHFGARLCAKHQPQHRTSEEILWFC